MKWANALAVAILLIAVFQCRTTSSAEPAYDNPIPFGSYRMRMRQVYQPYVNYGLMQSQIIVNQNPMRYQPRRITPLYSNEYVQRYWRWTWTGKLPGTKSTRSGGYRSTGSRR